MVQFFKYLSILIVLVVLSSCSGLQVIRLQKTTQKPIRNEGIVFSLPQTALHITVTEQRQQIEETPYQQTVATLLPERLSHQDSRSIASVSVQTDLIPDTSECYLVTHGYLNLSLYPNGVIAGINTDDEIKQLPLQSHFETTTPKIQTDYNHLFIKRNEKIIIDTTYRTIKKDSVVLRKPVYTERTTKKTKADIANDIYRLLIKVRKRRLRLITGIDTVARSAGALKLMLHRLDSLEASLYQLLTGGIKKTYRQFNFKFVPTLHYLTDTLAFWDSQKGINDSVGTPLVAILKLQPQQHCKVDLHKGNGFPYRVPQEAELTVSCGNTVFIKNTVRLLQLGEIYYLPIKNLSSKEIIFSPSGELIQIKNK